MGAHMEKAKSVAAWLAERGLDLEALVASSGLDDRVVRAIVHGRYTPSPQQRWRLAAAAQVLSRPGSRGVMQRRCSTSRATGRNLGGVPEMDGTRSVNELCEAHHIDYKQLAQRAELDEQRVLAIVLGRWTPSPAERDKVAAVFGLTRDQVTWGHRTPIQHIYGSGPA